MENKIWFLSGEGERHEDHIPHGIFSSLEEIKTVLREEDPQIEIDESNPNKITFTSYWDEDTIDFAYTAYCVPLNELNPEILRT